MMVSAEHAIRDATQSEAALVSAPDLRSAEDKLAQARAAGERRSWSQAASLTDEAYADAEYARAQATTLVRPDGHGGHAAERPAPASRSVEKLVTVMQTNPGLTVLTEGHTDNTGTDKGNLTPSRNGRRR